MGVAGGAGGGAIGSPMGGLLGSLFGGQISSTPAASTLKRNPVTGVIARPSIAPRPAPVPAPMPAPSITPASQSGFNVNTAAAQALQEAIGGTRGAMAGPLQVGEFMNPYQQAVIERTQQDIERQRQMAANQLGAQASAAGAFGGSRQGVAEGVLAGEYGRMGADIAAQQRQAGFSQAMQNAMADRAARLAASRQLAGLGQQAFGPGQAIQQQPAQQQKQWKKTSQHQQQHQQHQQRQQNQHHSFHMILYDFPRSYMILFGFHLILYVFYMIFYCFYVIF